MQSTIVFSRNSFPTQMFRNEGPRLEMAFSSRNCEQIFSKNWKMFLISQTTLMLSNTRTGEGKWVPNCTKDFWQRKFSKQLTRFLSRISGPHLWEVHTKPGFYFCSRSQTESVRHDRSLAHLMSS